MHGGIELALCTSLVPEGIDRLSYVLTCVSFLSWGEPKLVILRN